MRRSIVGRTAEALRAHWAFALVALGGLALRAAVVVAYDPLFWFTDTASYLRRAESLEPGPAHPWGYSGFLFLLRDVLGLRGIVILQHVMALALAGLVYAFVVRRGAVRWLGALAALPLALSPLLVNIEHHLLSDTLFLVLLTGGALLVAWPHEGPRHWAAAGAGLLLALAALTRLLGLFALPLAGLYLVVRRVGWTRLAAFAGAAAIPLVAYLFWMNATYGVYSFTTWNGKVLYARLAPIAECERLGALTADERRLCDPRPRDARPGPEGYLWTGGDGPAYDVPAEAQRSWVRKVVRHQPLDVLAMVARETAHVFYPGQHQRDGEACVAYWTYPDPLPGGCRTDAVGTGIWRTHPFTVNRPLARALHQYERLDWAIGPAFLACVVVTALGVVWRPRGPGRRLQLDAALLAMIGLAMTVIAIATATFSYRYTVPLYATLPPAAALALTRVLALRRERSEAPVPATGAAA